MDSRRDFTSKKVFSGYFSELGEKANSALVIPSLLLLLISHHLVLLSTACPTSLASEPNIRGGAVGCTDGTGSGAAFGGIDNDQPETKARQRHRARLDETD